MLERKLGFFVKIKPPAHRAYAPVGKMKILTTVILIVLRGLKFESDPREIGFAFHGAGTDIGEKDSFGLCIKYEGVKHATSH
jgi:hypothetical protein